MYTPGLILRTVRDSRIQLAEKGQDAIARVLVSWLLVGVIGAGRWERVARIEDVDLALRLLHSLDRVCGFLNRDDLGFFVIHSFHLLSYMGFAQLRTQETRIASGSHLAPREAITSGALLKPSGISLWWPRFLSHPSSARTRITGTI